MIADTGQTYVVKIKWNFEKVRQKLRNFTKIYYQITCHLSRLMSKTKVQNLNILSHLANCLGPIHLMFLSDAIQDFYTCGESNVSSSVRKNTNSFDHHCR